MDVFQVACQAKDQHGIALVEILFGLEALDASKTSGEWRQTWNALWSGTSSVSRTDRDVGLAKM